jgi:hypothetical protein
MGKLGTTCIAVCAFSFLACASKKPAPEPVAAPAAPTTPGALPSGTVGEETVTKTATVQKVDLKTRQVTLKDPDGKTFTIVAGEEVRNLPQVKKGDVLRVTYHQAIAYQVSKAGRGRPEVSSTSDVSRAPLGGRPAASVRNAVTVRTTIERIDKANAEVALRDPEGVVTVVKVRDPSKLDAVAVGDLVDITYTEALAIAVEKPK